MFEPNLEDIYVEEWHIMQSKMYYDTRRSRNIELQRVIKKLDDVKYRNIIPIKDVKHVTLIKAAYNKYLNWTEETSKVIIWKAPYFCLLFPDDRVKYGNYSTVYNIGEKLGNLQASYETRIDRMEFFI